MLSSPRCTCTSPGMYNVATHLLLTPASSFSVRSLTPSGQHVAHIPQKVSSELVIVLASLSERWSDNRGVFQILRDMKSKMKTALSRKQQYKDFFLSKSASLNTQPAYTYSPALFLERSFSVFSLKESLCQTACKCITGAPEEKNELCFQSSVCILLFLLFLLKTSRWSALQGSLYSLPNFAQRYQRILTH